MSLVTKVAAVVDAESAGFMCAMRWRRCSVLPVVRCCLLVSQLYRMVPKLPQFKSEVSQIFRTFHVAELSLQILLIRFVMFPILFKDLSHVSPLSWTLKNRVLNLPSLLGGRKSCGDCLSNLGKRGNVREGKFQRKTASLEKLDKPQL